MMLTNFLPSIIQQKRKKRAQRKLRSSAAKVVAPHFAASTANMEDMDWVRTAKDCTTKGIEKSMASRDCIDLCPKDCIASLTRISFFKKTGSI